MNYIQKLKVENEALKAELEILRTGIRDLIAYIHSPKFYAQNELDGYVNTRDVSLRLEEIMSWSGYNDH